MISSTSISTLLVSFCFPKNAFLYYSLIENERKVILMLLMFCPGSVTESSKPMREVCGSLAIFRINCNGDKTFNVQNETF